MELPEVIFPGSQNGESQPLYRRGDIEEGSPLCPHSGPPKPKIPNIYVKKPHRKQPALGLFLAKPDPEDREEDWRFRPGKFLRFQDGFENVESTSILQGKGTTLGCVLISWPSSPSSCFSSLSLSHYVCVSRSVLKLIVITQLSPNHKFQLKCFPQ